MANGEYRNDGVVELKTLEYWDNGIMIKGSDLPGFPLEL